MSALKLCTTCGAEYPANERFCPRDGTALRSQDTGAELIGSIIADRYHVIRKLGEGGMGRVYLAEHLKMGRKSAVKVMNPSMVQDADAISRFNREASNASRINHQNVAGIYDFGETADGLIYLAMEYVEGVPLTDLVSETGPLAPARAAEITRQTGEALSVAHEMGIVHRDLKPDNVMIARNRDGSDLVKVVDFGIAKVNVESQKVTRTGLVVGTPEYMSPEQISGDPLDGRSDIYSLGLVAFHMLTGGLPFPSKTVQESMIMRLTDQPQRLGVMRPDVPWTPEVQAVMDHALQRDVADRYKSASEFGRALVTAVKAMPKELPPQAAAPKSTPTVRLGGLTTTIPITRISELGLTPSATASVLPTPSRRMPMVVGISVAAVAVALAGGWFLFGGERGASGATSTPSRPVLPAPSAPAPASQTKAVTPLAAPLDTSMSSMSTITNSDIATIRPPASAMAGAGSVADNGGSGTRPASGTPPVTGPAGGRSYEAELVALQESVNDAASAAQAAARLPALRRQVTLARDSAAIQFVEAKVSLFTVGAAKGCALMRRIRPQSLGAQLKQPYTEGMQSCEGS
ncbi:MAG: serine/threonine-protein kinase [bacterium]